MCYYHFGTPGKKVLVYDSGYTKWDEETLCLLKKINSNGCSRSGGTSTTRILFSSRVSKKASVV